MISLHIFGRYFLILWIKGYSKISILTIMLPLGKLCLLKLFYSNLRYQKLQRCLIKRVNSRRSLTEALSDSVASFCTLVILTVACKAYKVSFRKGGRAFPVIKETWEVCFACCDIVIIFSIYYFVNCFVMHCPTYVTKLTGRPLKIEF